MTFQPFLNSRARNVRVIKAVFQWRGKSAETNVILDELKGISLVAFGKKSSVWRLHVSCAPIRVLFPFSVRKSITA